MNKFLELSLEQFFKRPKNLLKKFIQEFLEQSIRGFLKESMEEFFEGLCRRFS